MSTPWHQREPLNPTFTARTPAAGVVVLGAPSGAPPCKRSTKNQDVLRMSVIRQGVGTGGCHIPNMLVPMHGPKWGPTSNRMSKGKHNRSGNATGRTPDGMQKQANLCHIGSEGRSKKMYDKVSHMLLTRNMDKLRLMSARRCSNPTKYDRPSHRAEYVALWKKVITEHPRQEAVIEKFEAAHELRYSR